QQLANYPTDVTKPKQTDKLKKNQPAPSPGVPVFWLGQAFGGYSYKGMDLDQESWSNGSIVRLQYTLTGPSQFAALSTVKAPGPSPGVSGTTGGTSVSDATAAGVSATAQNANTQGSHQLDIREFQLSSQYADVMQVVFQDAAHAVTVNGL